MKIKKRLEVQRKINEKHIIIIVAITKYVSLGSILGIGLSPIIMIITHNYKGILVTLFLTISVAITHRENIKRLINGTERKLGEKKN